MWQIWDALATRYSVCAEYTCRPDWISAKMQRLQQNSLITFEAHP